MKFSIIVVCLNPGPKLNQTLDSILSQTYPSFVDAVVGFLV